MTDGTHYGSHWFCPHCDVEILAGSIRVVSPQTKMRQIVAEISELHGVSAVDVMGLSRRRPVAKARQAAMQVIRIKFGFSTPHIGRFFNRDHSTVLHALGTLNRDKATQLAAYVDNVGGSVAPDEPKPESQYTD